MLNKTVRLADQAARLPWPGRPGGFAPQGEFTVSAVDPFAAFLLADGSLVEVVPETENENEPPIEAES